MGKFIFITTFTVLFSACSDHTANHDQEMKDPTSSPIAAVSYDALYVVNGGDNSISVINAETNVLAATIKFQNISYPHHLNLSVDGSVLCLAVPGMDLSEGHGGGTHGMMGMVIRCDARTGSILSFTRCETMNHNAIFSPDGSEIWTSQMMTNGMVLCLNAASLSITRRINVGSNPAEITFSRDGEYAFVANGGSNTVSVIDPGTKSVVKTIPVGANPVGAWPGSDNVMYVDNEDGKSITAIDASTLDVVRTYNLGFTPGMAVTAPNDELWITDSDNGKVVRFARGSDTRLGEITSGRGAHAIAFSSDGKTAYITNQADATVTVIDVASLIPTKTIGVGNKPNGILWRGK